MLTERRIRDAKPAAKTSFLWDGLVKGLGVRITTAGVKSFVVFYRADGRKRLMTLARCSDLSLKVARERAGQELVAIRNDGADPLAAKREAREAPTFAEGWARFLGEFAPERVRLGKLSPRTLHNYRLQCARYILPKLGGLKIAKVTRQDVEAMVRGLPPTTRNRVLALTSRLFSQFERWEYRAQHDNPARGIERASLEARDRTLAPSELAALSAALDAFEERHRAVVAAIRIAAVTGLRIGEILAMRWEHVDLEQGRLTLPESKSGRRQHDLPTPAQMILSATPRLNGFVFTTGRGAAVTYRHVRHLFAQIAREAGLADVRLHDLRRTVMTAAAAAGVGTHVLRDLLGHKTTQMADRYVRAVGSPVRDAREQVGTAIAGMMRGEAAKVVNIRGR